MALLILLLLTNPLDFPQLSGITLQENMFNSSISAFDACHNSIYVIDRHQVSLTRYTSDGTFQNSYSSQGAGPGDFHDYPKIVHCTTEGTILVIDEHDRFHYFKPDLSYIGLRQFDAKSNDGIPGITSGPVIIETKDQYITAFTTTIPGVHYVTIDKHTLKPLKFWGHSPTASNFLLERGYYMFNEDMFVSISVFSGTVRILNPKDGSSTRFEIQQDDPVESIQRRLGDSINSRDPRVRELFDRGSVAHSSFIYNGHIYIQQRLFTDTPLEYFDVYNFEGTLVKSIPVPEMFLNEYTGIANKGNLIYAVNQETMTIYFTEDWK